VGGGGGAPELSGDERTNRKMVGLNYVLKRKKFEQALFNELTQS
jgi:hypothetical protein